MIVIAGDSYCHHHDGGTWIDFLRKSLEMPVEVYSKSGCSWWATRRQLVQHKKRFKDVKVVIFCHTEGTRVPNPRDEPIGAYVVRNRPDYLSKKVRKAVELYYDCLYDPEFSIWTQQQWFNECVTFFPDDAYIIHLHSFSYTFKKMKTPRDLSISPPLFGISDGEFLTTKEHFDFIKEFDSRKNHMNTKNNLALGKELLKIIESKPIGNYTLDLSNFDIKNHELIDAAINGPGDIMDGDRAL